MSLVSIGRRASLSSLALLTAVAALSVIGCKPRRAVEANDLSVSIAVNRTRVPQESPIEVTYTWTTGPNFKKLTQPEYRAFVHFADSHKQILFQDDHAPEPAPSTWEPGKTYSYTRTVFVPVYPYVGEMPVTMGLYATGGGRVGMKGEDLGLSSYKVASLELLPRTENIFLVYKDGWHSPEAVVNNPSQEHSWTKKDALVSFKNPKEDVIVYLAADTNFKAFPQPPVLTVSVGSGAGLVIPIESSDPFVKKIRFKADALGKDEWVDLHLTMSESFVPKALGLNQDDRELALLVDHLYVGSAEQLGQVPPTTVVDAAPVAPAAAAPAKGAPARAAARAAAPASGSAPATKKS